ncbi:MAG: ABC transporter inner membrane protein [candidate division CPR3 bacterium GW2011_GWE2_35_7]|nr:MAG: ABC transporter inner membrane protein [candidate division CPR3 bacterium GW2011_GWE2_35_7]
MNRYLIKFFQIVIALIVVYFLWKGVIWIFHYPTYILPAPSLVSQKLVYLIQSGKIYPHLQITLTEIFAGFLFGSILAMFFGYIFAKKRILHLTITPYIVAFQSIPIVALAPIFIIWFGSGITSKIVICSIIVFFPVMVNTITAISNIEETKKELMCTLNSSLGLFDTPQLFAVIFILALLGIILYTISSSLESFFIKRGQKI